MISIQNYILETEYCLCFSEELISNLIYIYLSSFILLTVYTRDYLVSGYVGSLKHIWCTKEIQTWTKTILIF